MSKSRKKYNRCGEIPSCSKDIVSCEDPSNRYHSGALGKFDFPTDIKKLLILIAEDEDDNRVDIILDACAKHCLIEDARVIAVMDNTVVIKECDSFRYVCIGCICEVIVDCDTIMEELFEEHSFNRE